jgi:prepilin-type N-terminal cleavage/methylation domain-containing protein
MAHHSGSYCSPTFSAKSVPLATKAFTLLETLIVMSIVAVVIGVGIQAFVTMRQLTEFQQAKNEFAASLRAIQNAARNGLASSSVIATGNTPADSQVAGYAVITSGSSFIVRGCTIPNAADPNTVLCNITETRFMPSNIFSRIRLAEGQGIIPCTAVYFKRITGRLHQLDPFGSGDNYRVTTSIITCTWSITHRLNSNLRGGITFNTTNGTISTQ